MPHPSASAAGSIMPDCESTALFLRKVECVIVIRVENAASLHVSVCSDC